MSDSKLKTINPATGETIREYDMHSEAEAKQIVEACHQAFTEWRHVPFARRGDILKSIAQNLLDEKQSLAELMTKEMGKPIGQGLSEVDICAAICEYTAENGADALADEERELPNGGTGLITHQPIGVIYGIQPWNFPLYQVIRYSIANLMAGNTVLLKHAEAVTGSGLALERIFKEAGLPENAFRVLLIDHDTSDKIIENDRVRGVTLTGSDGAGRLVGAKAAENLKKTVLELGSNDAFIVLHDADLDVAMET